jgi:hypothetical protein
MLKGYPNVYVGYVGACEARANKASIFMGNYKLSNSDNHLPPCI